MTVKKQFSSFSELLEASTLPVLVDFYANWCGPCRLMASILEQVNAQMHDRLQIVKIDSDQYPQLASQYRVEALPTLILFKDGQPVDTIQGVVEVEQLVKRLQSLL